MRHPKVPAQDDLPGWLFLAQHYGLPTRLLDWTESPLMAAFFAIQPPLEGDASIWALNPFALNLDQLEERSLLNPIDPRADALIVQAFQATHSAPKAIAAVYPDQHDLRVVMQLATYTIHGVDTPLDELPNADEFLIRYDVPHEARHRIARSLDAFGIRLATIFPDLTHLAAQLRGLEFDG